MWPRVSVVLVLVVVGVVMLMAPSSVDATVLPWLFTPRAARRHTEQPRYDPYLDLVSHAHRIVHCFNPENKIQVHMHENNCTDPH